MFIKYIYLLKLIYQRSGRLFDFVIEERRCDNKIIHIGDSKSDYQAARERHESIFLSINFRSFTKYPYTRYEVENTDIFVMRLYIKAIASQIENER